MANMTSAMNPRMNRIDFFRLRGEEFLEGLYKAVADTLGEQLQASAAWPTLTPYQQGVVGWRALWCDVPNGGLEQFFFNWTDAVVPGLAELLRACEAARLADLIDEAAGHYRAHQDRFRSGPPWAEHESPLAGVKDLGKLEDRIVKLLEKTSRQVEKWARANIGALVAGDDGLPIDPDFSGQVETRHANGAIFEEAAILQGKIKGTYRRFFDNGVLEQSCFYDKGEISSDHWPSGQVRHKKSAKKKQKILEWFYPSGQLQKRVVLDGKGVLAEPVRLWHDNGQLAEEAHKTRDGREARLGPWLRFFDDGSPRLEAEYLEGEKLVVKNAWDDQRRQVVKDGQGTFYDDGIDWTTTYSLKTDPMIFHGSSVELRDGIRNGKSINYRQDGSVASTVEWQDGKLHGVRTSYYDNGRVSERTTFADGKQVRTEALAKFDNPRPAVRLSVECGPEQYDRWKLFPLDVYPVPANLDEIQAKLRVPSFLQEIQQRQLSGEPGKKYEDLNHFSEYVGYQVSVNEQGNVDKVRWSGCSPYSVGTINDYPPLLRQLKFKPGQVAGRAVPARVIVWIYHTFEESGGQ